MGGGGGHFARFSFPLLTILGAFKFMRRVPFDK